MFVAFPPAVADRFAPLLDESTISAMVDLCAMNACCTSARVFRDLCLISSYTNIDYGCLETASRLAVLHLEPRRDPAVANKQMTIYA